MQRATYAIALHAGLALAASTSVSAGQDWPQFRGSDGCASAHAPQLPLEFTLADANWRIELAGSGDSSPAIHGDRVVITSVLDAATARIVQCLDARSGAELWSLELPFEPYESHDLNSFASSTPVVDDERIYLTWPDGDALMALALDFEGQRVWSKELGPYLAQHGGGTSPVLVDDTLVVANDNESDTSFLVGLDPATGEERWRRARKTSRAAFATPVVYRDERGKPQVIFASTSHGLTSLDPTNGALLWEVDGLFAKRCVASPVVAGRVVFTTAGSGGGGQESAAVHVPQNGEQARLQYRVRRSLPYVPSPVAAGKHLFTFNDGGIVSCLRAETGATVWSERVDGEFFGSPVVVDQRVYALSKEGVLFAVAARDEFELLAAIELGEPSNATPAVANGVLYLRTDRHLIAVGGAVGK